MYVPSTGERLRTTPTSRTSQPSGRQGKTKEPTSSAISMGPGITSSLCGRVISNQRVFCNVVEIQLTCVAPVEGAVSIFLLFILCTYLLEPGHRSVEYQTRPGEGVERSERRSDCPG